MAKHDIVTYNPTTQGFETDLQDNTAQIKGEGNKILSVESGSTTLFSVGADNQSISINTNLTASGDISSSVGSTGSFSVLEFTKISGDASQLTFVNETNHVSGAAQVASRISGAFDSGFEILGDLSGSVRSSGSFGKVFANHYVGDASLMTNVNEEGHFSSSAQLSSNISGSFNKGFEFTGTISGSAQSTGSFGNLIWGGQITADASTVTNLNEAGFISSSGQLSSEISSSFQRGFVLEGTISGSMTSTASFHVISASTYVVTNPVLLNTPLQQIEGIISGAIQLENSIGDSPISGAFDQGFEFTRTISGSAQSTGSFTRLDSITLSGDATQITDLPFPDGTVSSSAQIATSISGSFTSGFKFTGEISGSGISTGSFGQVWSDKYIGDFSAVDAPEDGYISGSGQIESYISGSWNSGIKFGNNVGTSSYWAGVSGSSFHYAKNATTMSISSLCGSDYDYRLFEKSDLRGYRGITFPYGAESGQFGPNYAVWSVTSALITARSNSFQFGSAEAALAAGGYAPGISDTTEKFDGASWAASATLAEVRVSGGSAGTQNAALIFGGRVSSPSEPATDRTEQYNGSTWSEVNNMTVGANGVGGLGTQNAAVVAGQIGAPSYPAQAEQWNGNVWSEVASHNDNRSSFGMGGSYDAGMMVAGSPTCTCSELWDGTTWTATSGIPNGQRDVTFIGSSNAGFLTGGHAQVNGGHSSDSWDGTVWINGPNLNQSRGQSGKSGVGLSSNGLMVGGAQNTNPAGVILSCTENITVGFVNTGSWYMACADSISVDDFSDSTYTFETASMAGTVLANVVSGSFNKGFEYSGNISGSVTSTASLSHFKADTVVTSDMTIGSDFINSNISSSFTSHITKPHIIPRVDDRYFDTKQYMPPSGQLFSSGSCAEFSNGYDAADGQLSIGVDGILNISFQTSSFNQAVIPGTWSAGPDTITMVLKILLYL